CTRRGYYGDWYFDVW
nr:immunoglobulin heavy chain junction region [Mus musculus]MBK4197419.1 immunoglobulin heavy chain junction region [Mus musculus]MBK4197420.1 immunoglobulin heavy chain junction region [Mus musculus]MBK4197421.1 immunoglobulin heavy chain junction region [Mus musculus]MBK4197422.1 immunoglobulin heavy chain junction region [Mus musculus]